MNRRLFLTGFGALALIGASLSLQAQTITVSSSNGPVAVNGVATGLFTFTADSTQAAPLPITYTVTGTGVSGTDYTALTGTATILAGSDAVSVPVTAAATATPNATVIANIAPEATYQVGTASTATVVLEGSTYSAAAQNTYGSSAVAGSVEGTVTLTFSGLPGNPTGTVYVWYLNGSAFTTTTTGTYSLTNAQASQSGAYSVYACAPNGVTGSQSFSVTITSPFTDADIGAGSYVGAPGQPGSASYNPINETYTVNGGGADIYGTADQFNFYSEPVTGNTTLIAHIDSQQTTEPTVDPWAKAGLMFRDSLAAGAANVAVLQNPGGLVEMQWRDSDNGGSNSTSQINTGASTLWLKLVSASTGISGYFAVTAGVPGTNDWILIATHTTAVFSNPPTYLAGLAVTAHNNSYLGTAVFSNFNYIGSAPTPTLTSAVSATSLLGSIGVCTHVTQARDDPTQVPALLTYAGIANVRDDGTTNAATLQSFINIHNQSGAKYCLLPVGGDIPHSLAEYDELATNGALMAVEGPNELNNYAITYNGQTTGKTTTFLPGAQFQRDLYTAVKADNNLGGIPVFAPSEAGGSEPDNVGLQYVVIPTGAGTSMPDGTVYGDYANTHNYLSNNSNLTAPIPNTAWGAEDPTLDGAWDGMYVEYCNTWNKHFSGYPITQLPSIPRVTTETGWVTQGANSVTEDQQGKLFLNLFLDAYRRGWAYTFIYMLRDDASQGYWGLFHTDNSPKLSATYLHNLTTILADAGTSSPGSLSYAIPNEPITVHDMLIQKSNGAFELAVWDEEVTGTDSVTVNLGASAPVVNIYDPTVSATATQVLSNVTSVPLTLSDHPVILEIGAPPAPPVVTLSSSSGPLAVNGVATGMISFKSNFAPVAPLPITYTVSGTANPGTDYTVLTGTVTIAAGKTSACVPVTAAAGATPNATVIASIATTATYQAGTSSSATVVLESSTYNATAQNEYSSATVTGSAGSTVTLTFPGLAGPAAAPAGTIFVWYSSGTAVATTTTPTYSLTNAQASQTGTYSVYAYAPGAVTYSESYNVTVNNPTVTVSSSTGPLAVNGLATGEFTFTSSFAPSANLPITYTVTGTGISGTDYTALSGTATILAGTTSISVPVTAAAGAAPNATVIANIATTSTYQAGTASSATVTLEGTTFSASAQNAFGSGPVAGTTGSAVPLTFQGLPGNPTGTIYIWYLNGTAFTTTTTGTYTLTNAQIAQSGTYSVYAFAPGGVTGSESYTVTISNPVVLPIVTVSSSTGPLAVNGVATGQITFTSNTAPAANLPITYTVTGSGNSGTDYTALSGTATILAGTTSISVPVTAAAAATPNATVIASIATTSTYQAGTPSSAKVVLEGSTFNSTAQNAFGSSNVTAFAGSTVTLTVQALPGNPTGTIYVWYLNGIAFTTTTTGSYTLTGALASQSGTYSVYAYAPSGVTASESYAVTINNPTVTVSSSTGPLAVNGLATGKLTFTSNTAPTANLPITYTVTGTGIPGTDYTVLSGTATILAGTTSISVPVTAAAGATPNATVIASIATTSTYTAGTPSSATVVLEGTTFNATAQNPYGSGAVTGTTGSTVTLTFQGLPGNPTGTVYVWYLNGTAIATTTTGTYTLTNAQTQSNTYSVYAYAPGGVTGSESFTVTVTPATFTDADIGSPSPAGSASVNTSAGTYTVSGGGADIYGASDQFNFYSESATGNGTLIAHVDSQTNTSVWAKAGLMFRNDSTAGSAWVGVFQNPGNLLEMQWRDTANAQANWPGSQVTSAVAANWLELVKTGNSYSAYYATTTGVPAANNWILIATHTTSFPNSTFLAGLAVTSHNNGVLGSAVFSQFTYPGSSTAPTLPIVTLSSSSGPVAVNGLTAGAITFTSNTAPTANLPITYTVSGTASPGTGYVALSGSTTIPAGTTSVSVPVSALPGATSNATVTASIATTSTYQAGTVSSATVVLEPTTFNATAQSAYGTSAVAGSTGGTVTLTFLGLPGNPTGTFYVWYLNGTAFATSTTGTYSLTNAQASQSGTYAVYAYAPGGVTGSESYTVTITTATTSSFTDADIGSPSPAGSASYNSTNGTYTVSGGGADIYGASDQFNFYSESATGNATLIAQVTSQANTSVWAKAGLMFRNSTAAGDAWVGVFQNPGGLVEMQWRDSSGAQANWPGSQVTTGATVNWLELVKTGNSYSAYYATTTTVPTSANWILIATHTTTFVNSTFLAGLAVTSHNNGVLGSGVFSNFTYPGGSTTPPPPTLPTVTVSSTSGPLAVNGLATGQITFTSNTAPTANLPITYTVSGTGIPGTDYTALSGTATILAGTTSISVPVTAAAGATPNATVIASIATTSGYQAGSPSSATVTLEGTTYSASAQNAYGSSPVTGSTGSTVTLTFQGLPGSPTGTVYVWYLNGTAIATTTTGTYTLTNAQTQTNTYSVYAYAPGGVTGSQSFTVTVTVSTTPPSSFTDADIGGPSPAGSASVNSGAGTYTVSGGGADIYGASDQFNFYSESATGNGTLIAHVDSQTNTSVWAKAGLMFRNDLTAGSAWVGVFQNPGNLLEVQWRDTANGQANWPGSQVTSAVAANWLELVKTGNSFSAYYATTTTVPTSANWILIATHTTSFTSSTFLAGLAVTSHNNGVLGSAVFSQFTYPGGSTAPTLPVVTVSSNTAAVAVNGVATGEITFTINSALTANLPITYTVSGSANPGTDYITLSGTATIPAGTTSVSVPVSALPGATPNATVTASVTTTAAYQAGTVSSATVVLEGTTFSATAQNAYGTSAVAGSTGSTVALTFQGLPGSPTGTVYVWYLNGTAFTTTTTGTYSLTNAQIAQSGTYSVYAYAPGGVTGSASYTVTITTATTPSFTDADIGSPSPAGSASVNSSAGTYTVSGGGADIYGASDQFNFYSESATGNATLIAHVDSQTNTSVWAKAGLMFRNDLTAGSAWVGVFQNPGGLVEIQWRDTANAQANWPGSQVTSAVAANWLELVKTGNSYSAYYATTTGVPAANNWILIATHTTTFTNSTFLAGLAVTSHNNGVLGSGVFSGFTHP